MRNAYYALLSTLVVVWGGGCTDRITSEVAAKNDSNIKRLVNLYDVYRMTHGWQGPHDEQTLKKYVKDGELPAKNFHMMGIDPDKLDQLFVSQRDGQPFKVKYGVAGGNFSVTPIVFEQTGVGGKKQVGFNTPIVEEVDENRYNELWEKGGLPTELAKKGPERMRPGGPGQEPIIPGGTASKR